MGTEPLFRVIENVSVLNATELYPLKWLILSCEFHLNKKNKLRAEMWSLD